MNDDVRESRKLEEAVLASLTDDILSPDNLPVVDVPTEEDVSCAYSNVIGDQGCEIKVKDSQACDLLEKDDTKDDKLEDVKLEDVKLDDVEEVSPGVQPVEHIVQQSPVKTPVKPTETQHQEMVIKHCACL